MCRVNKLEHTQTHHRSQQQQTTKKQKKHNNQRYDANINQEMSRVLRVLCVIARVLLHRKNTHSHIVQDKSRTQINALTFVNRKGPMACVHSVYVELLFTNMGILTCIT